MKKFIRSGVLSLLMTFVLFSSAQAAAYYVVIGTFAEEANARRFTRDIRNVFSEVSYTFNDERKVWYVHVFKSDRREEAQQWSRDLKTKRGFEDAWVYTDPDIALKKDTYTAGTPANRQPGFQAERALSEAERISGRTSPVMASAVGGGNFLSYTENESGGTGSSELSWTGKWGVSYISNLQNPENFTSGRVPGIEKIFTFIVEDPQGREIPSEVMLVDFEKVRKIASFKTGEHAAIRGTRREQMLALVCDVLGYTQETRMYNIDHLGRGRDIRKNDDGVWEVRFRLRKMEVNDVAFMNETVFYDDAAILEPSSRAELEELLAILTSNPSYRIIIHGHCNPQGKRDIRLPVDANGYFDNRAVYTKTGSDKRLTKERARTIRNYLIDRGVHKKRIGIIGWGSSELLVKSTGPDASMNERIEFELVED